MFSLMRIRTKGTHPIHKEAKKKKEEAEEKIVYPDEICVACGKHDYIPEGSMLCYSCMKLVRNV